MQYKSFFAKKLAERHTSVILCNLLLLYLTTLFCYRAEAQEVVCSLSRCSEEYNTNYIYCGDFANDQRDTTVFLPEQLPMGFVLEVGALKDREKTAILYDDDKELVIANRKGRLTVDGKKIGGRDRSYTKLSLYFVNGKLLVYLDDKKTKTWKFPIEPKKKVGLRISKKEGYVCRMFNCYEPVPFKVADYGAVLDDGDVKNTEGVRASRHSVGADYNLTFPTDITKKSNRSIRFEYRFQDTKKEGASNMQRGRSEISGVFAYSPKNKWIIEYDLYIPNETQDDESATEIITQIHEGSSTPTSPAFCLYMKGGYLGCTAKGDNRDLSEWVSKRKPSYTDSKRLLYLQKERWYHIKIYLKEGWRPEDQPLTRVWVDGAVLYESTVPNCYKYDVRPGAHYDYLKFGIYKSGWLSAEDVEREKQTRVYYFDNYVVKY